MYKLRFISQSVHVATHANRLYKLQLVQVDLYKLEHVQILDLYKLQLVQAPYFSVEQGILINLFIKIHKINRSHLQD